MLRDLGDVVDEFGLGRGRSERPVWAEEAGCRLPPRHHCSSGWHWREDGGQGTAYARCPRVVSKFHAAAAERVPGDQTFASFDAMKEPTAFEAVRDWVKACRSGCAKLALVRPSNVASSTGCGKSHLLRAAARDLARAGRWVETVTAWELAPIVRARTLYDGQERAAADVVAKKWAACEVLILDPLGPEETIPAATSRFLVVLLDQRGPRSVALASNLSEAEIGARYGEEVASRLLSEAAIPPLYGKDFRRHGVAA